MSSSIYIHVSQYLQKGRALVRRISGRLDLYLCDQQMKLLRKIVQVFSCRSLSSLVVITLQFVRLTGRNRCLAVSRPLYLLLCLCMGPVSYVCNKAYSISCVYCFVVGKNIVKQRPLYCLVFVSYSSSSIFIRPTARYMSPPLTPALCCLRVSIVFVFLVTSLLFILQQRPFLKTNK